MDAGTEWLLEGPPWVQYRTRLNLLGQGESEPEVLAAREATAAHPQVQSLLQEVSQWPHPPLKRHNDASHPLHKLVFLVEAGLRADDMAPVVERILSHQSPEGAFQVLVHIAPRYGGTGEDQPAWMLCDAPLTLYVLARWGLRDDPRVEAAAAHLASLVRENGWPCAVSPDLGKFRGPGRKSDPCPYATLVALKALAQLPKHSQSEACRIGAETLLTLWTQRRERRPYLFAMGTHFARLKAPLIWYDVLHVTDVLTQFPWLKEDPRLREMVDVVRAKADAQGRFTPESVWKAWRGWEFGQKREPSRWLTLVVWQMLRRLDE